MTPRFPVCDGVPASGLARGPLWAAAVLLAVLAQSLSADPPVTWTEEQLDAWLAAPHELAPRMCPGYTGIRDPERRRALIIYLKDPAAY